MSTFVYLTDTTNYVLTLCMDMNYECTLYIIRITRCPMCMCTVIKLRIDRLGDVCEKWTVIVCVYGEAFECLMNSVYFDMRTQKN